jgi:hypothetical protein
MSTRSQRTEKHEKPLFAQAKMHRPIGRTPGRAASQ